jgi:hypothetical protein
MSPLESIGEISQLLPNVDTPTQSKVLSSISQTTDLPPLLFRAFSPKSAGVNSPEGFRAHDFSDEGTIDMRLPTPPDVENSHFLYRMATHYRRSTVGSPVISTTCSLPWAIHKAYLACVDEPQQEPETVKISVIDVASLNSQSRVYVGRDLYSRLKSIKGAVPHTSRRYKSSAEYPIWGVIDAEAVIKTISLHDLQVASSTCPSTQKLLRLDYFTSAVKLLDVLQKFKAQPIDLDTTTIIGFINIIGLFGVSPISPPYIISYFANSIIDGWLIDIQHEDIIEETFHYWLFKCYSVEERLAPEGLDLEAALNAFREGITSGLQKWKNSVQRYRSLKVSGESVANGNAAL